MEEFRHLRCNRFYIRACNCCCKRYRNYYSDIG